MRLAMYVYFVLSLLVRPNVNVQIVFISMSDAIYYVQAITAICFIELDAIHMYYNFKQ